MKRSTISMGLLVIAFTFAFALAAHAQGGTRGAKVRFAALALLDDIDRDGIPDAEDNCLEVSNPDQADLDGDGVGDVCDNCLMAANPAQDDCDDDYCGNLCDCDYNQDGQCDWGDFGIDAISLGKVDATCQQHYEPITPERVVDFGDFGFFSARFGLPPGPSGTTPGTVACPIW